MLTTKKFKREVEKLGFRTTEDIGSISIYYGILLVSRVYKNELLSVRTAYAAFDNLSKELKEKLYNLIDEYVKTPIEDREEPQKFYLQFTALTDNGSGTYLNYYKSGDSLGMSTRSQSFGFQTEFTQKEIDEIKEKFGVTLSDFRQIPVDEYCEEDEEIE